MNNAPSPIVHLKPGIAQRFDRNSKTSEFDALNAALSNVGVKLTAPFEEAFGMASANGGPLTEQAANRAVKRLLEPDMRAQYVDGAFASLSEQREKMAAHRQAQAKARTAARASL